MKSRMDAWVQKTAAGVGVCVRKVTEKSGFACVVHVGEGYVAALRLQTNCHSAPPPSLFWGSVPNGANLSRNQGISADNWHGISVGEVMSRSVVGRSRPGKPLSNLAAASSASWLRSSSPAFRARTVCAVECGSPGRRRPTSEAGTISHPNEPHRLNTPTQTNMVR